MNLEKRREDIQLGFRRERVIAALVAHRSPIEIVQPEAATMPKIEPIGFMSDQASKALFGY